MSYAVRNDGKGWRVIADASQVGEGETFSETEPSPLLVPDSVTLTQAKLALLQTGKLDAVNAAVSSAIALMPGQQGQQVQIYWTSASRLERNNPLLQAVATAAGLTPANLDALFILAATL